MNTPMSMRSRPFQMTCSHCGKEIPVAGDVCPYCNADKTGDRIFTSIYMVGMLGGMVLGGVVGVVADLAMGAGGSGWMIGGISGGIGGSIFGGVQGGRLRASYNRRMERKRREEAEAAARQPVPAAAPAMDFAALARQQEAALLASGDYRKCPHCAEVVKSDATLCRFCGRSSQKSGGPAMVTVGNNER